MTGAKPATAMPAADAAGASPPAEAVADLLKGADAGRTDTAPAATAADITSTTTPFALPQLTTAAPAAAAATPASAAPPLSDPSAPVPQLHGDAFADDIGTHVHWLAEQKIGHAHIRISPQELGPVEIRLQLDGDRISADFTSAQPEVRQALESSLPRLREMLGQSGFQLAHAGVGQQSRQDGNGGRGAATGGLDGGDGQGEAAAPMPARRLARGLLDAYA
ncbi:flagellar hook-length control protein FliK [Pseudoxanthomonas sp. NC8]|nr:flagellar hook-length control protein FliK [Pseudoxanthomonas sp. NC8]